MKMSKVCGCESMFSCRFQKGEQVLRLSVCFQWNETLQKGVCFSKTELAARELSYK